MAPTTHRDYKVGAAPTRVTDPALSRAAPDPLPDGKTMAAAPVMISRDGRAADVASRLLGRTLNGTYRILDLLDHGGMGAVFVAEHVRLGRRVAVKVLATHLTGDSKALARFALTYAPRG